MDRKRVVITGVGAISPLGLTMDENWKNLISGVSGIKSVKKFEGEEYRSHYAGEVDGFDIKNYFNDKSLNSIGLCSQFALAATKMALEDASLIENGTLKKDVPSNIGVAIGTTMGDVQELEKVDYAYYYNGYKSIDPKNILNYPADKIANNISSVFSLTGPNTTFTTACAASNYAFGYGFDLINSGAADIVIAGGADVLSKVAFCGFSRIFAMATEMCQPFSLDRKGMIVSEGAIVLIMESLESAERRGTKILAEFLGYGLSCDAFDITIPHENGLGAIASMEKAIKDANIDKKEIGYISAHGTGTKENDRVETLAIKNVFGDYAKELLISSTKSMSGHLMGASSALEAAICVKVVNEGVVPPTINYTTPDPECDLDYIPNAARKKDVSVCLSNAFAFGGNNASIIIKRWGKNSL